MPAPFVLQTSRLRLRPFCESDLEALARLNADPETMRYLGSGKPLDRAATWKQIAAFCGHMGIRGYSILAIDDRETGEFLGRGGIWYPAGWPMVEVGWVVDPRRQRQGIATEAGRAALNWCFDHLGSERVCSLIAPDNAASARVAEKLGARLEDRIRVSGHEADLWIHRRPADHPPTAVSQVAVAPNPRQPVIETARLRLRPFREADLDELARLYADADVMRYIGSGATLDRDQTWRQIALFLGHAELRGYATWAIEDRATGQFLGECGPWFPEGWPMLEVGWLVDPRRQREGIATEAARAAVEWCFDELRIDAVGSIIRPDNVASARVAEKLGARRERSITLFGREQELWVHRPR